MNWIRQEKRLAIYLRDGLSCTYCSTGVEQRATLTLDHVKPWSKGGGNEAKNLVTACESCNKSKGDKTAAEFCDKETIEKIKRNVARPLSPFLEDAKVMIELRGSAKKALKEGER